MVGLRRVKENCRFFPEHFGETTPRSTTVLPEKYNLMSREV
jgi:hypothetical protein